MASAQVQPAEMPALSGCEALRKVMGLPYYYCDCEEKSTTFAFPLEEEIKDTMWYSASVNDLRQGISAYWFADCSVTLEVYAFCTSKEPTFSVTVEPNQMCDVDVTKINQQIEEMGETARLMAETLTPHIRVYPNEKGGSGRVYCYPYGLGPMSTCEDPLPLRPRMVLVSDKAENVYRMEYNHIDANGKAFVLWKQKENKPCRVWLTLDSCAGEEIGRASLSDSLHVFTPDSAQLVAARQAQRPIWLHVSHADGLSGRIYWYNRPRFEEPGKPVSKKTCEGKTIKTNLRSYSSDTAFVDTIWVASDTLTTVDVKLTFTPPTDEYDTVRVAAEDLMRGYRYTPSGTILYNYTDTIIDIIKTNTCTRRIHLSVMEPTGTEQVRDGRKAYKQLQNGQLFIIIDDRKYTVLGQKIN